MAAKLKRLSLVEYADGPHLVETPAGPWTHYKTARDVVDTLEERISLAKFWLEADAADDDTKVCRALAALNGEKDGR